VKITNIHAHAKTVTFKNITHLIQGTSNFFLMNNNLLENGERLTYTKNIQEKQSP